MQAAELRDGDAVYIEGRCRIVRHAEPAGDGLISVRFYNGEAVKFAADAALCGVDDPFLP